MGAIEKGLYLHEDGEIKQDQPCSGQTEKDDGHYWGLVLRKGIEDRRGHAILCNGLKGSRSCVQVCVVCAHGASQASDSHQIEEPFS